MNKNNIIYFTAILIIAIIAIIFAFPFIIKQKQEQEIELNIKLQDNIEYLANYLETNHKDNYPFPSGNLILMDNNLERIHMEDKTKSLDSIENLYVIQGTLCNLDINDEEFNDKNYDIRYSIGSGENKKCFSYAVTNDRKYYQIGRIDFNDFNNIAKLKGNIAKSITKDYQSDYIVIDGGLKYLPYAPAYNDKIILKLIDGDENEIELEVFEDTLQAKIDNSLLKNGIALPKQKDVQSLRIKAKGDKYLFKIIYPDSTIVTLSPNQLGDGEIQINNFDFDGINSKVDIVNVLGKIAYNIGRLGDNTQYDLHDNQGGVLVIRGTQFNMEVEDNYNATYLVGGKIQYKKENNTYIIDMKDNIIGFENNKKINLIDRPDRVKGLYSYSVATDIYLKPKPVFTIDKINELAKLNIGPEIYNDDDEENIEEKINSIDVNKSVSIDNLSGIGLKLNEIFNLKDNQESYYLISLSGLIDQQTMIKSVQSGLSKKYLNNELAGICQELGKEMVGLDQAYKFMNINEQVDDVILFENIDLLTGIVDTDTILVFYSELFNNKNDNLGLVYFDLNDGQIKSSNLGMFCTGRKIGNIRCTNKRKKLSILCK